MNIVLITQDDPFYLAENVDYLIRNMPSHSKIQGCVVFEATPFCKKETVFQKIANTYRIFGGAFLTRYILKFIVNKFDKKKKLKTILKQHGITVIEPEEGINSDTSLDSIRACNPDLLITISGNQIFRKPLLELAPKGCIVLHTSLLPKYRGLMPGFWVLRNNEKYTGISVIFTDEGVDSGPILLQRRIEIGDRSLEELIQYTKAQGMDLIIESISLIEKGGYEVIENDESHMTYFSFPAWDDVKEFLRIGKRFY